MPAIQRGTPLQATLGPRTRRFAAALCLASLPTIWLSASPPPATHRVTVGADGAFAPAVLRIRAGDTVEWAFARRTQAVVAAESAAAPPAACPAPRAFAPGDTSNFTGPLPFAPSGIYSLAPLEDRGLRVQRAACPGGRTGASANGLFLCGTGPALTTMDETWADPNNTGVFIRLLWNRLQTAAGTADASFDFTDLDREVSQAVRHGKLYSLAIKAGNDGTPDWIFSTDANGRARPSNGGGVVRLMLQDGGSDAEMKGCGVRMSIGSPTDPAFQRHYFDMLTKVAEHLRARSDWFRALAYIKPSGANLFSHENRLPKRCSPGCVCNTEVFARNGYTPSRLYEFYRKQFALLKKELPGKAISYQLIQDGFPAVNDSGGWETADGRSSNGKALPAGAEQTERIIEMGQSQLGSLFVVQHNGLQVYRADCDSADAGRGGRAGRGVGRRGGASGPGLGCPNRWVIRAGADGRTVTGFQTQNPGDIRTPADVDLALKNAHVNSRGVFVELYEAPLWLAVNAEGGRLPGGKTVGQWADEFHERRRARFQSLGDPLPLVHRHTFSGVVPGTLTYFEPSACRAAPAPVGTIIVER